MISSIKRLANRCLRRAMEGDHKNDRHGLSIIGQFLYKVAWHIQRHSYEIRQGWQLSQRPRVSAPGWKIATQGKIVYDFGANRGNNIPYYIRQGFRVVAVEANPKLASLIEEKYRHDDRVIVVNACLVEEQSEGQMKFFVHKSLDVLSTSSAVGLNTEDYEEIEVIKVTPKYLFDKFGGPFYVKIDIEGLDGPISLATLKAAAGLAYISVEVHSIVPFCNLVAYGFSEFKIIEGASVGSGYYDICPTGSAAGYKFSLHDAGPFGEDIPGDWMNADETFAYLARQGTGWKDIHARRREAIAQT